MDKLHVLFGLKEQWEPWIRNNLDFNCYDCTFADFRAIDIAEFDLVVPLTLEDYNALEEQRDAARSRALYPSGDVVALCNDKLLFNRFIAESEFGWTIPPLIESGQPRPPYIFKRREDEFGQNTHLVLTAEDAAGLMESIDPIDRSIYFAQTYVPGDKEYATHLVMNKGELIYHLNVTYEMDEEFYVKGERWAQKRTIVDKESANLNLFESILFLVGFQDGACCFNYKIDNGRIQIFELNPRFGGSLATGINGFLRAYEEALAVG